MSCSPNYSYDSLYRTTGSMPSPMYHTSANHTSANHTPCVCHGYCSGSAASNGSYCRPDSPPPSTQILGEYFNAGINLQIGKSLTPLCWLVIGLLNACTSQSASSLAHLRLLCLLSYAYVMDTMYSTIGR